MEGFGFDVIHQKGVLSMSCFVALQIDSEFVNKSTGMRCRQYSTGIFGIRTVGSEKCTKSFGLPVRGGHTENAKSLFVI